MSESIQAALTRIEDGIEAARNSDRFREYLAFCGRFHQYSFGNQVLIWSQRPEATLVAGFRAWLTLKRYVRKGAKGILILAPMTGKRRREEETSEEDEGAYLYFKAAYVFDVSQTEGEPLPSPVETLQGGDETIWHSLSAVACTEGITIDRSVRAGESANGFYVRSERLIWVSPELSPVQSAKTLAHELSHHFADHVKAGHKREEAEMVAESSAYVVMAHFGCDAGDYSFGYLASWGDAKLFRQRLQDIHKTAKALLEKLSETPEQDMVPDQQ